MEGLHALQSNRYSLTFYECLAHSFGHLHPHGDALVGGQINNSSVVNVSRDWNSDTLNITISLAFIENIIFYCIVVFSVLQMVNHHNIAYDQHRTRLRLLLTLYSPLPQKRFLLIFGQPQHREPF